MITDNLFLIGLRLFGESYSGLEYDYKGLCNVYEYLNDTEKYLEYSQVLEAWRIIRDENLEVCASFILNKFYFECFLYPKLFKPIFYS